MKDLKPSLFESCPPLPSDFFARNTVLVARDLLGCRLMRHCPESNAWRAFTIVETEAYTADDPACHAYQRKTGRAEMLYKEPGTAYVYLIYGMYDCLNVVTEPEGTAGAVLFRALEPPKEAKNANQAKSPSSSSSTSATQANARKHAPGSAAYRTHGPGRLTRALHITRQAFNGIALTETSSGLYLAAGSALANSNVVQTTRIGITKATDYPWRFYIRDNPWVSVACQRQKADFTGKKQR